MDEIMTYICTYARETEKSFYKLRRRNRRATIWGIVVTAGLIFLNHERIETQQSLYEAQRDIRMLREEVQDLKKGSKKED